MAVRLAARTPRVADENWTPEQLDDDALMRRGLLVLRYRAIRRRAVRRGRGRWSW